jgi:hypothetical protein
MFFFEKKNQKTSPGRFALAVDQAPTDKVFGSFSNKNFFLSFP